MKRISPSRRVPLETVLRKLKTLSNPKAVEGMARFGISPKNTLGVSIPNIRRIAKDVGRDHVLAQELWASGIHEARILAGMVNVTGHGSADGGLGQRL